MSSLNGEPVGITAPTDPNKLQDFMLHTVGKLVDKYVKGFMETKGMSVTDTEINSKSSTKTTTATSRHIAEQDGDTNYAYLLMNGLWIDGWGHAQCLERRWWSKVD